MSNLFAALSMDMGGEGSLGKQVETVAEEVDADVSDNPRNVNMRTMKLIFADPIVATIRQAARRCSC